MKLRTVLFMLALSLTAQAAVQAPQTGTPGQAPATEAQQKKQITDPAEYNAYVAALNEPDAAKKSAALDAFLGKYPNTVVKEDALELKMVSQIQAQQSPEQAAKQLLQVNPRNLRALIILSNMFVQTPLMENDPQFQQKVQAAEEQANTGLQVLPSFNPPNVSAEDLKKTKDASAATFHEALGVVGVARKQFGAAQKEFVQAGQLTADNAALFYRLGNAYISERPDPKYGPAFWAFARATAINGPSALPPAGKQQVDAYLAKIYTQYHGSEEGLAQLKQQAAAQPFAPPDFKVMSKAEVAAAAPVDPATLQFDEIRTYLTSDTPKGEEVWSKMKGSKMSFPQALVVSATPAPRPRTLRLAVLQTTAKNPEAYDIELALAQPVAAAKTPAGKIIGVEGIVNAFQKEPFVVNMVDGKLMGQEEEAPPAAKKAPARKAPARKRR